MTLASNQVCLAARILQTRAVTCAARHPLCSLIFFVSAAGFAPAISHFQNEWIPNFPTH